MRHLVHIVLSDRGWILERLAKEISDRLPYVEYDLRPNRQAPIQYYNTYGCRQERVSPIEIGLFTHQEKIPSAAERFLNVARDIDHCIAMSNATGNILRDAGIENFEVISPGVDLDRFRPKLKIAVVGRTYHTGRKGEAVVNGVMDIPDIEWHFTGDGWPGPAMHVLEEDLPAFYRSMDYILVPAVIEGGPMCVLEALASGVPVIGSPVGWVPDFPHIPFDIGDSESLRRVLIDLRDKKFELRASVEKMTWDNWAEQHDRTFRSLAKVLPPDQSLQSGRVASQQLVRKAALVLHGVERSALGGPTLRVPETARMLGRQNVSADVLHFSTPRIEAYDLVHSFNVWKPGTAIAVARQAARLNKPLVFSPIILDLCDREFWTADLIKIFQEKSVPSEIDAAIAEKRRHLELKRAANRLADPSPDYADRLRELASLSDAFIFLSQKEQEIAARYDAVPAFSAIVHNAVDSAKFSGGDPALFREAYGITDYVLCVGRIEARKNQLLLVHALRETGLPIVLVGHNIEPEYSAALNAIAGPNVLMLGRLEPGSPMLLSVLAGARVFTLPSFAEGAPLAALEAGAAGLRMVLSDRSGEQEYFGNLATYCDPADPVSIRDKILEAWDATWGEEERATLQAHVAANFSWDRYARETAEVYESVAARRLEASASVAHAASDQALAMVAEPFEIVFDVSTNAMHGSTRSGITRVERSLGQALLSNPEARVRFVAWGDGLQFQEVPSDVVTSGLIKLYLETNKDKIPETNAFVPGSRFVVTGSSWMQNNKYAEGISQFAGQHELQLSVLMHDMTPDMFPFWFQKGYSNNFRRNLTTVLRAADRLLVYSKNTWKDLEQTGLKYDISLGTIGQFRLADVIDAEIDGVLMPPGPRGVEIQERFQRTRFALATGAIHARKNYSLLYDVWLTLRDRLGDACPHLIIVGGVSWNGEDTARALQEDSRLRGFVHILEDIDDATLDWLYKSCLMTVYPSLYEGWGLPIGESLSYGKICISSNSSSMSEIAPDLTDLLDPLDRQAWASRVQLYATSRVAREAREEKIREHYKTTTWHETAAGMRLALAPPLRKNSRAIYNLGAGISIADPASAVAHKNGGWFPCEPWGSWASQREARLRLDLANMPDGDLVFAAVIRMFGNHPARKCVVTVNGTRVGSWSLPSNSDILRTAIIPRALIPENGRLDVRLQADFMQSVLDVAPKSGDLRSLGLGLSKFMLHDVTWPFEFSGALSASRMNVLPTGTWVRSGAREFVNALSKPLPSYSGWGFVAETGHFGLRLGADHRPAGMTVSMLLRAPASASKPVSLTALVNGIRVGNHEFTNDEPTLVRFDLPAAVLTRQDAAELVLLSQNKASPAELKVGLPKAAFAFGVLSMRVDHADDDVQMFNLPAMPLDVFLRPTNPQTSALWRQSLAAGWYQPEANGVWSAGKVGQLRFRVAPGFNDLVLFAIAARLSSGEAETVHVTLSGAEAGMLEFPAQTAGTIVTSEAMVDLAEVDEFVELGFEALQSISPFKAVKAADDRALGVFLSGFWIRRLPALVPNAFYRFGEAAIESQMHFVGWHPIEVGARWTAAAAAQILLRLPVDAHEGQLVTLVSGFLIATVDAPVEFTVHVAGIEAGRWTMVMSHEQYMSFSLTAEMIEKGPLVWVTIETSVLTSPSELGIADDNRLLGAFVRGLGFGTEQHFRDLMPEQTDVLERPVELDAVAASVVIDNASFQSEPFDGALDTSGADIASSSEAAADAAAASAEVAAAAEASISVKILNGAAEGPSEPASAGQAAEPTRSAIDVEVPNEGSTLLGLETEPSVAALGEAPESGPDPASDLTVAADLLPIGEREGTGGSGTPSLEVNGTSHMPEDNQSGSLLGLKTDVVAGAPQGEGAELERELEKGNA